MLTKEKCDQRFDFFWDLNQTKYRYDATGRRIERVVTDLVTPSKSYHRKYVYDGEHILAILDGSNNLVSAVIHGNDIDSPLAMVTDYNNDGQLDILSFLTDHLGSVKYVTNQDRQILEEISYSAYGETHIKRRGNNLSKIANQFYYTGREIEPETGDYYYRARYYDPYSQKFLSEDPIGFAGGDINFYRYTGNNPLIYFDPLGTDRFIIGIIAVAGALGLYFFGVDWIIDNAIPAEPKPVPQPEPPISGPVCRVK